MVVPRLGTSIGLLFRIGWIFDQIRSNWFFGRKIFLDVTFSLYLPICHRTPKCNLIFAKNKSYLRLNKSCPWRYMRQYRLVPFGPLQKAKGQFYPKAVCYDAGNWKWHRRSPSSSICLGLRALCHAAAEKMHSSICNPILLSASRLRRSGRRNGSRGVSKTGWDSDLGTWIGTDMKTEWIRMRK